MAPTIQNGVYELEHLHVDHIKPQAKDGGDQISNRLLLCGPCNNRKSDKYTYDELVAHNTEFGKIKNERCIWITQSRREEALEHWRSRR